MIKTKEINGHTLVTFKETDKITAINAEGLKKELNNIFNDNVKKLIISFENINFIDSTGFGIFLSVMKTAESNDGELKLCNVNQEIMKLFKLLHLDNVFDIYNTVDDCLK